MRSVLLIPGVMEQSADFTRRFVRTAVRCARSDSLGPFPVMMGIFSTYSTNVLLLRFFYFIASDISAFIALF